MSRADFTKAEAAAYLAGMIDGEGTITLCYSTNVHPLRRIAISGTETDILEGCVRACEVLGIYSRIYRRTEPSRPLHWAQGWDVVIYGRDNFERIAGSVPLQSGRKRAKLDELLATYKTAKPYRRRNQLPTDDLIRRYEAGESNAVIARAYGVSESTVDRWKKLAGIPNRSMSDSVRLAWATGRRVYVPTKK